MKNIFISFALLLFSTSLLGQNNSGTPYSKFAIGLLPDNYGAYTAMGGISAAIRDNYNINFLNPASYTALDSNRFYFQLGVTGEHVDISTYKQHATYKVAQNASVNMAFRVYQKLFMSLGLTQRSDRGFDLYYTYPVSGADPYYPVYSMQQLEGLGGLNEFYIGAGYQLGKLSLGMNVSYIFGKIEDRLTLMMQPMTSGYYLKSQTLTRLQGALFTLGAQLPIKIKNKSEIMLGTSFNFGTPLHGNRKYLANKISNTSGQYYTINDEALNNGRVFYPFRIITGASYQYDKKWFFAGDYTFQRMSAYEEFDTEKEFNNYHKIAIGTSLQPNAVGRYWWQRNKYMAGAYFTKSHLNFNSTNINTYGVTVGSQIPIRLPYQELMLGIAVDLGVRGTHQNNQIMEKYVKLRINIAFKELWFMKAKIN
jgi:hypothetical protein